MEPNQEKKKVSKENSYYYWWDEKNKNNKDPKKIQNLNAPKKITVSEAKKLSESQKFNNHSQWNSVGTWEEKVFKVEDFQAFMHSHPGKDFYISK